MNEEVQMVLEETQSSMFKALKFMEEDLRKIRAGKASPDMLIGITVEYYGMPTPLNQVASVKLLDARTIVIQPFERKLIGDIERAILTADLGFNPQNDGNVLRIPVPPLTEERRLEYVKVCRNYAEEGRVAIRNSRRSAIEAIRSAEKEKEISEDQQKDGESDVQTLTDKYIAMVDEVLAKKEKELIGKD